VGNILFPVPVKGADLRRGGGGGEGEGAGGKKEIEKKQLPKLTISEESMLVIKKVGTPEGEAEPLTESIEELRTNPPLYISSQTRSIEERIWGSSRRGEGSN